MVTPFRAGAVPTGGGTDPHDMAASLAATTTVTYLADVSEFQPDVVDVVYLAWSHAIVIRAAYGDAHDDQAWYGGTRRAALHAGGVKFLGIYQYLVATQDGGAQANALHDLVGPLQPGEVLIADFETGVRTTLTAWYNRMLALGYPGRYLWTYTGLNFGQAQGVLPVEWIAAYGQGEPTTPHKLWQFSSSYSVPGVGTCDCSVFHGSIDELAALGYSAAPKPPPAKAAPPPAPGSLGVHLASLGSKAALSWGPVKGVSSYAFQLEWWKPQFGWVLTIDTRVSGTDTVLTLNAMTRYRWRVSSGTWSDWTEFDTP